MASKSLGTLTLDLVAKIGGFEQGMDKAARKSKQTSASLKKDAADLGKWFGALGVAAGAAGIAIIKSSIDSADAMSKQSKIIGVNIEELSALSYAADLSDVSFEQLSTGLKKFSRSIDDAVQGTGAGADAFDRLAINVENADGSLKSTSQLVAEVAGKFAGMEDGAVKTSLAMDLFGKSGAELIPLLNEGAAGIEKMTAEARQFGLVIGADTGAAAEEFNDNLTRLQKVISGTGLQLSAELLPSLVEFTDLIKDPGTQSGLAAIATGLADIAINATKGAVALANFSKWAGESIAASFSGPAADDLVRISDRLNALTKARSANFASRLIDGYTDKELDAEIKRLQKMLDDGYAKIIPPKLPKPAAAKTADVMEEVVVSASRLAEIAPKLDPLIGQFDSMEESLQRQIALFGDQTEFAALFYDLEKGNLKDLDQLHKDRLYALQGELDAMQDIADMQKEINDDIAKDFEKTIKEIEDSLDDLKKSVGDTGDEMTKRWEHAVENMQDAFADFLFDPFADGLDGMLKNFGQILQRMVAEAAAAQIFDSIIGAAKDSAGSGGLIGTATTAIGSFFGYKDGGGTIPSGGWGIVGERGPEIVRGPAAVTSRMDTAKAMSGGRNVTIGSMVFPGVTNEREARRAGGAAAREIARVVAGSGRYS